MAELFQRPPSALFHVIPAKVERRECGVEAQWLFQRPPFAVSQAIPPKVERRSVVLTRSVSLCQRPPSAFSQVAVFETQHSHLAPRVQAVLLVQQPFAAGELNSSLACTTAPAFSTAVRIVFDVSAILSCSRAASWGGAPAAAVEKRLGALGKALRGRPDCFAWPSLPEKASSLATGQNNSGDACF